MGKNIGCSIIIKDDFNNVLIIQRKTKKSEPKLWSLCSRAMKGKDTTDKCLDKAAKDDLKSVLFDVNPFNELVVDEETGDSIAVYTAIVKERVTLGNDVVASKWINKRNMDSYEFNEIDKQILLSFWGE